MVYTSFVEERVIRSKYDHLKAKLNSDSNPSEERYLLTFKKNGEAKLPEYPEMKGIIDMGETLDIIVVATPARAKSIAADIYRTTSQYVGIARHEPSIEVVEVQSRAEIARDIAEETHQAMHLYEPQRDSFDGVLGRFNKSI